MSATPPATTTPDTALLKEAADWVMALRYGGAAERDAEAFERWRRQSPAHGEAWARAEAVMGSFAQLPAGIGKNALGSLQQQQQQRAGRRRSLQLLGALLVAAPAGWLAWRQVPWQEWSADIATTTGERRTLQLADGTQLVLNTATAVDIAFTATERRVHLRAGEILVTTGHADPSPTHRPFTVQTAQGSVQALGTRFSVRQLDGAQGASRVAVFEHAVQVHAYSGATRTLRAGEQADFTATAVQPAVPVDASAALWEQGMLLARGMRLADVLAEMARHRSGMLRCHPAVADLQVSGAIALGDTDMALALLERSLPVRVERLTKYWVTVGPQ
jgi:transmembrane sensor